MVPGRIWLKVPYQSKVSCQRHATLKPIFLVTALFPNVTVVLYAGVLNLGISFGFAFLKLKSAQVPLAPTVKFLGSRYVTPSVIPCDVTLSSAFVYSW